jgi:hypothetical protein
MILPLVIASLITGAASLNAKVKLVMLCYFVIDTLPTALQRLYSKKNMVYIMGPYAGVDYGSPYLISQLHSQLSAPNYKGRGVERGTSLLLVENICICLLISKTTHRKSERGREGVRTAVCL